MAFDNRYRRRAAASLFLACGLGVLTACGSAPKPLRSGMMTMPDGTVMSRSQMSAMPGMTRSVLGPSVSAKMICSDEIAAAVQRNLAVSKQPSRSISWADQTYTCNYTVPGGGTVRLVVKDLTSLPAGKAWFDGLRKRLTDPVSIKGMANLGFPAFQTPAGDVAFLKDGKTLWVNATRVPQGLIPSGSTRTDVAYGVAAAVIACWKE